MISVQSRSLWGQPHAAQVQISQLASCLAGNRVFPAPAVPALPGSHGWLEWQEGPARPRKPRNGECASQVHRGEEEMTGVGCGRDPVPPGAGQSVHPSSPAGAVTTSSPPTRARVGAAVSRDSGRPARPLRGDFGRDRVWAAVRPQPSRRPRR